MSLRLQDIAEEYLRSFPTLEKEAGEGKESKHEHTAPDEKSAQRDWLKKMQKGEFSAEKTSIDKREQVSLMFSQILSRSEKVREELARHQEPVLDTYSWQDMSLLAGNKETPGQHLLNRIKRTHTTAGDAIMAMQMVTPHAEAAPIHASQGATKALLANKAARQELDGHMENIAAGEAVRLSFWKRENPLTNPMYKRELGGFYFKRFGLASLNRHTWGMQIGKFLHDLFSLHPGVIFFAAIVLYCHIRWVFNSPLENFQRFLYYPEGILLPAGANGETFLTYCNLLPVLGSYWEIYWLKGPSTGLLLPFIDFFTPWHWSLEGCAMGTQVSFFNGCWAWMLAPNPDIRAMAIGVMVLQGGFSLAGIKCWRDAFKNFSKSRGTLQMLASYLQPFQELLRRARKISELVQADSELDKYLAPHLQHTRALLKAGEEQSSPLGRLVAALQKVSLENRWYFFSDTGRMLAAYTLLQEHKHELADLICEMGYVDMYLSLARLVEESDSYCPTNRFIFGSLDTQHSMPVLHTKKMWHVGLDAKEVVTNDLEMDAAHGVRTIIITGPNAGGKSTYILGIASNVVLHQAFGIAAADHFVQTVFGKIITYVNVTQNLSKGLSLAEAGMEVLKQHKQTLDTVRKPVLAIIDEILNGVNPQVAEDMSYKILAARNKDYPHCLTLLTTHFKGLTRLADEDTHIQNKKVVVRIPGDNGRAFAYTYKIEPGISDQDIVAEMLEEKGVL